MTVGTGDLAQIRETLFAPLRVSIDTEAWTRVVLLPSGATQQSAQALGDRLPDRDIEIRPLPDGAEYDADRAYSHFDGVLAALLREMPPECIEADFTRGTKAMSAALVLAATRRAVPVLRYITGDRDKRGVVTPGTEQVQQIRTTTVDCHRRLDLARDRLRRGDFATAAEIPPASHSAGGALLPPALLHASRGIRVAARFYAAWDRLDYASAAEIQPDEAAPLDEWKPLWPTVEMREWVAQLEAAPERTDHRAMAAWLRRLVVDLLANGERRVRQGQHEDALVRAYRVLELVGQARLFDHGLDSGRLEPKHAAVRALQEELERKGEQPLSRSLSGELQTARLQAARLLRQVGDPLAKRLLKFEQEALLKPTLRNNSVLVHGFVARAPQDAPSFKPLFDGLERLILDDGGDHAEPWLRLARSPACFGR